MQSFLGRPDQCCHQLPNWYVAEKLKWELLSHSRLFDSYHVPMDVSFLLQQTVIFASARDNQIGTLPGAPKRVESEFHFSARKWTRYAGRTKKK